MRTSLLTFPLAPPVTALWLEGESGRKPAKALSQFVPWISWKAATTLLCWLLTHAWRGGGAPLFVNVANSSAWSLQFKARVTAVKNLTAKQEVLSLNRSIFYHVWGSTWYSCNTRNKFQSAIMSTTCPVHRCSTDFTLWNRERTWHLSGHSQIFAPEQKRIMLDASSSC